MSHVLTSLEASFLFNHMGLKSLMIEDKRRENGIRSILLGVMPFHSISAHCEVIAESLALYIYICT